MVLLSNRQKNIKPMLSQHSMRHKNSTKPSFYTPEPQFYLCEHCQRLTIDVAANRTSQRLDCCGRTMKHLLAQTPDGAHHLTLTIRGGFESNSLSVTVGQPAHPMTLQHHIAWMYLHTFQGGQLKFMVPGEESTAMFALADKDAYVYCDRAVCKGRDCKFNCKRGFCVWVYCNQHGLWHYSL